MESTRERPRDSDIPAGEAGEAAGAQLLASNQETGAPQAVNGQESSRIRLVITNSATMVKLGKTNRETIGKQEHETTPNSELGATDEAENDVTSMSESVTNGKSEEEAQPFYLKHPASELELVVEKGIMRLPYELVLKIAKHLDLCSATSFGLICPKFYRALKEIHPNPISLKAPQFSDDGKHGECCYGYLHNNWKFECPHSPTSFPKDRLANILVEKGTFRNIPFALNYRFIESRGDHERTWIFINIRTFDSRTSWVTNRTQTLREWALVCSYADHGLMRQFDETVEAGHVRLPTCGRKEAVGRKSLLPYPFGMDKKEWAQAAIKVITDDRKHWARRLWWARFWASTKVFLDNKAYLMMEAEKYPWGELMAYDSRGYMERERKKWETYLEKGVSLFSGRL